MDQAEEFRARLEAQTSHEGSAASEQTDAASTGALAAAASGSTAAEDAAPETTAPQTPGLVAPVTPERTGPLLDPRRPWDQSGEDHDDAEQSARPSVAVPSPPSRRPFDRPSAPIPSHEDIVLQAMVEDSGDHGAFGFDLAPRPIERVRRIFRRGGGKAQDFEPAEPAYPPALQPRLDIAESVLDQTPRVGEPVHDTAPVQDAPHEPLAAPSAPFEQMPLEPPPVETAAELPTQDLPAPPGWMDLTPSQQWAVPEPAPSQLGAEQAAQWADEPVTTTSTPHAASEPELIAPAQPVYPAPDRPTFHPSYVAEADEPAGSGRPARAADQTPAVPWVTASPTVDWPEPTSDARYGELTYPEPADPGSSGWGSPIPSSFLPPADRLPDGPPALPRWSQATRSGQPVGPDDQAAPGLHGQGDAPTGEAPRGAGFESATVDTSSAVAPGPTTELPAGPDGHRVDPAPNVGSEPTPPAPPLATEELRVDEPHRRRIFRRGHGEDEHGAPAASAPFGEVYDPARPDSDEPQGGEIAAQEPVSLPPAPPAAMPKLTEALSLSDRLAEVERRAEALAARLEAASKAAEQRYLDMISSHDAPAARAASAATEAPLTPSEAAQAESSSAPVSVAEPEVEPEVATEPAADPAAAVEQEPAAAPADASEAAVAAEAVPSVSAGFDAPADSSEVLAPFRPWDDDAPAHSATSEPESAPPQRDKAAEPEGGPEPDSPETQVGIDSSIAVIPTENDSEAIGGAAETPVAPAPVDIDDPSATEFDEVETELGGREVQQPAGVDAPASDSEEPDANAAEQSPRGGRRSRRSSRTAEIRQPRHLAPPGTTGSIPVIDAPLAEDSTPSDPGLAEPAAAAGVAAASGAGADLIRKLSAIDSGPAVIDEEPEKRGFLSRLRRSHESEDEEKPAAAAAESKPLEMPKPTIQWDAVAAEQAANRARRQEVSLPHLPDKAELEAAVKANAEVVTSSSPLDLAPDLLEAAPAAELEHVEPEPEVHAEPEPGTQPEVESEVEPEADAEPEAEAEAEPQAEAGSEPEAGAGSMVASQTVATPVETAAVEPTVEPTVEQLSVPAAEAAVVTEAARRRPKPYRAPESAAAPTETPIETATPTATQTATQAPIDLAKRDVPDPAPGSPVAESASPQTPAPTRKRGGGGRGGGVMMFVVLAVLAVGAVFGLRAYVVAPYYIPSGSMEKTLHGCSGCNDDHVLADKLSYHLHAVHRGDIVVFNRPETWASVVDKVLIKRVIGLPGDTLSLDTQGHLFINGQELDEPYLDKDCPPMTTLGQIGTSVLRAATVPPSEYFVMGDNRCGSEDSRVLGPIPRSSIIGRAFLIIWPLGRIHYL